jgi:hypothetical protein
MHYSTTEVRQTVQIIILDLGSIYDDRRQTTKYATKDSIEFSYNTGRYDCQTSVRRMYCDGGPGSTSTATSSMSLGPGLGPKQAEDRTLLGPRLLQIEVLPLALRRRLKSRHIQQLPSWRLPRNFGALLRLQALGVPGGRPAANVATSTTSISLRTMSVSADSGRHL